MLQKWALITLVLFFSRVEIFAQKDSTKTTFYKNELLLDISPAIRWAIITSDGPESVAFGYRRYFKPKHAFRVSFRGIFDGNASSTDLYYGYRILNQFLTKLFILEGITTSNNRLLSIRTGYEYIYGKRRVKGIVGLEILNGISTYNYSQLFDVGNYILLQDLVVGSDYINITEDEEEVGLAMGKGQQVSSYNIGFSPVLGFKINVAKRWSIDASMLIDFYYNFPYRDFRTFRNNTNTNNFFNSQRGFQISAQSILTDVSICYRFGN